MASTSLLYALISMVCGGTIVPLIYTAVVRYKGRTQDDKRAAAKIEEISSHAAREAVEATKGALEILREQLHDGHSAIALLERERIADRQKISSLEAELARLRATGL